jgi:hypothetical protein
MTSFEFFSFLDFFAPETIFIGGWDTKFIFKILDLKQ